MNSPEVIKRIAVCISGQIRTGEYTFNGIKKFLSEHFDYGIYDFFIHTWDSETCSKHETPAEYFYEGHRLVEQSTIDNIRNLYNPVRMVVDNYNDYLIETVDTNRDPRLTSLYKCNQLKKDYELENNIKYYLVLKIRFDLVFQPDHYFIDEIRYWSSKSNYLYVLDFQNKLPQWTEDVAWLGTSDLIDIASDFVFDRILNKPTELNKLDAQEHLNLYLKNNGIDCHHWKNNNIYIYRKHHIEQNVDVNDIRRIMDSRSR